jgi:hypothetical protein
MNRQISVCCAWLLLASVFVLFGCEKHPLPGNPPVQAEKKETHPH